MHYCIFSWYVNIILTWFSRAELRLCSLPARWNPHNEPRVLLLCSCPGRWGIWNMSLYIVGSEFPNTTPWCWLQRLLWLSLTSAIAKKHNDVTGIKISSLTVVHLYPLAPSLFILIHTEFHLLMVLIYLYSIGIVLYWYGIILYCRKRGGEGRLSKAIALEFNIAGELRSGDVPLLLCF